MVLAAALPASADSRRAVSYDRPHKTLSVSTGISVRYNHTNTKSTSIEISAPDNIIDLVVAESRGNTIYIKIKSDGAGVQTRQTSGNVLVTVSGPLFNEFEASSGSRIVCQNNLAYSSMSKVEIDASSAATVIFAGIECGKLDIESSSAASVKVSSVRADKVDAEASSAARCEVTGINADKLDVEASSASDMTVAGKVRSAEIEASSASTVNMKALSYENIHVDKSSGATVRRSR